MEPEFNYYTQVSIARIEAADSHCSALEKLSSDLVAAGNSPGQWTETPEMSLAHHIGRDARNALHAVYDDVRVTPDLPQRHVLEILNRRFQVTEIKDWCEELVAKGGQRLRPGWLRTQVTDGIVFKDRPLDPKILTAAVLMDAEREVRLVKQSLMAA